MTLLVPEKDQILRAETALWDFQEPAEDAVALSALMYATMRLEDGVGLAAPQIGKSLRVFVMGDDSEFKACFNPRIVKGYEPLVQANEGCLSFPGLTLKVSRWQEVDVQYYDAYGTLVEEHLDGLWSRCFQHELDHLFGICFDQRVGAMSLELAKKRRAKALKGKR